MKRTQPPLLCLAFLLSFSFACHHPPKESEAVVGVVNGEPITLAEVDQVAGSPLYQLREATLQRMINDRLLRSLAKKAGVPPEQYLRQQLELRAPPATDAEAEGLFNRTKDSAPALRGKTFAEVKDMVLKHINDERRNQAAGVVSDEMRAKADIKINLRPVMHIDPIGSSRGPADAKVTIIEFSDFQCPVCSQGAGLMDRLLKEYDGKVRLVFRDFPLAFHPEASGAAVAGRCADEQGKFWELHNYMFANPEGLGADALKAQARKLGLDGAKFDACLTSSKFDNVVADSIRAGKSAGVTGAPAFFINGVFMPGVFSYESFKAEIERALSQ